MTWFELGRRAGDFQQCLLHTDVRPGDVVFIIAPLELDLYCAFLGVQAVGAIPSILPFPNRKQDETLYWSEQCAVFERTGAKILFTTADIFRGLSQQGIDIPVVIISEVARLDTDVILYDSTGSNIALLQHSSGTTGVKKGVALTYDAVTLQLEEYANCSAITDCSVVVSWLPLYHDMGLIACFLLPLYRRLLIVSIDTFDWTSKPSLLLNAIETHKGTHVWTPNFALLHICRTTPLNTTFDLTSLVAVIGCSEPNKPFAYDLFVDRFLDFPGRGHVMQACYAMAETVFAISQTVFTEMPTRRRIPGEVSGLLSDSDPGELFISSGRPLKGVEVRLLAENGLVAEDILGEICVYAGFLFSGYFNDAILTADAFIGKYFKTGDIGFISDGELFICGRRKELLIVNGRKFFAHDLEECVGGIGDFKSGRICVLGLENSAVGSEQIVVLAERVVSERSDAELIRDVNRHLGWRFGVAAGIIRIVPEGWLVKSTSGKMSRAGNRQKLLQDYPAESSTIEGKS